MGVNTLNDVFRYACMQDETCFLAIDPGASGAVGVVCGLHTLAVDIPVIKIARGKGKQTAFDYGGIIEMFRDSKLVKGLGYAVVEKPPPSVGVGPGRGSAYAQFRLGCGYAMWPLFLLSKGFKLEEVSPHVWKRAMKVPGGNKESCRHKAIGLFPDAPLSRKKDHNRAEALLLAEYLRRLHNAGK